MSIYSTLSIDHSNISFLPFVHYLSYFHLFSPSVEPPSTSFVSPHKSNKIKSNFICTAHFIQGGKTMRLTVGKKGGGLQTLVKKTQIFQRSINRKLRTNHTGTVKDCSARLS